MSDTAPIDPHLTWDAALSEEGPKPFAAFCRYRDQGSSRSLVRVGQELHKSVTLLGRWSVKFEWVERARAYDAECAEQSRKTAEAEHAAKLTAYRERAARVGAATADVALSFLVAVGKRLKSLTSEVPGQEGVADIPIKSLPAFLRAAAAVAQISLTVEAEALGIHALEDLMKADEDESAAEG